MISREQPKKNFGFTLVELIIVIAILAILAATVGLSLTRYLSKARKTTDIANAGEIATAANLALAEAEGYDSLVSDLFAELRDKDSATINNDKALHDGNLFDFESEGNQYLGFCICVTPQTVNGKMETSELGKRTKLKFAQIVLSSLNKTETVTPQYVRNIKHNKGDQLAKFYLVIIADYDTCNILAVEVYVSGYKDQVIDYVKKGKNTSDPGTYQVYPSQTGIYG